MGPQSLADTNEAAGRNVSLMKIGVGGKNGDRCVDLAEMG